MFSSLWKKEGNTCPQISTEPTIAPDHNETCILASGWFWGPQHVFQKVNGIVKVVVGYTGGKELNPTYKKMKDATESYLIEYNPTMISYEQILKKVRTILHCNIHEIITTLSLLSYIHPVSYQLIFCLSITYFLFLSYVRIIYVCMYVVCGSIQRKVIQTKWETSISFCNFCQWGWTKKDCNIDCKWFTSRFQTNDSCRYWIGRSILPSRRISSKFSIQTFLGIYIYIYMSSKDLVLMIAWKKQNIVSIV